MAEITETVMEALVAAPAATGMDDVFAVDAEARRIAKAIVERDVAAA